MTYVDFIRRWTHPDYPPQAIPAEQLSEVETVVGFTLPQSFKEAMIKCGAASVTLDLFEAVRAAGLDIPVVHWFETGPSMIKTTRGVLGLLPPNSLAFAADDVGNTFFFRRDDEAVWFWDHDENKMRKVSENFDRWIDGYCAVQ